MRPNRPGARGCPDTTSPGGGALQAVLAQPRSAVLRSQHRPTSLRTPRRSGRRRFKSCLRLESDGTEYPNKEVRVDSTLAPDYNLSDQPGRAVLLDADLGSLCLPIHNCLAARLPNAWPPSRSSAVMVK